MSEAEIKLHKVQESSWRFFDQSMCTENGESAVLSHLYKDSIFALRQQLSSRLDRTLWNTYWRSARTNALHGTIVSELKMNSAFKQETAFTLAASPY